MARFEVRIGGGCVLWLSGDLDLAAAADFVALAASAVDGEQELILDMSRLEFLDSAGLRAILEIAARTDRGVLLRSPRDHVRKLVAITGIDGRRGIRMQPPMGSPDRTSS